VRVLETDGPVEEDKGWVDVEGRAVTTNEGTGHPANGLANVAMGRDGRVERRAIGEIASEKNSGTKMNRMNASISINYYRVLEQSDGDNGRSRNGI
jgi:hypothetical protein